MAFAGGTGTVIDPYLVETPAQLDDVRNYLSDYFRQIADISLAGYSVGMGWEPIGSNVSRFTGGYDGDGYTISNLTITRTLADGIGLFGYISGADIRNITLASLSVHGRRGVGALAGWSEYSSIDSITAASGSVRAAGSSITQQFTLGGIAGYAIDTVISRCNNSCTVAESVGSGSWSLVGGIAGGLYKDVAGSSVTDCVNSGAVTGRRETGGITGRLSDGCSINTSGNTADIRGYYGVGGLTGFCGGALSRCYNSAVLVSSISYNSGGLAGEVSFSAVISNCYSRADVQCDFTIFPSIGAAFGRSYAGSSITYCYSTGKVYYPAPAAPPVDRGFIGKLTGGTCTGNFFDLDTSLQTSGNGATGLNTPAMKTESTFTGAGWDFSTIWDIDPGTNDGYPFLLPDILSYTLDYAAGTGGTLSGVTHQTVYSGGSGTPVEAIAEPDYVFSAWSDAVTDNPRTDTGVVANINVTALFLPVFTLTYSDDGNGHIDGVSPQSVIAGGDGSPVTPVPDAGYKFFKWSDGTSSNPRQDTVVASDISVTARFIPEKVANGAPGTVTLTKTGPAVPSAEVVLTALNSKVVLNDPGTVIHLPEFEVDKPDDRRILQSRIEASELQAYYLYADGTTGTVAEGAVKRFATGIAGGRWRMDIADPAGPVWLMYHGLTAGTNYYHCSRLSSGAWTSLTTQIDAAPAARTILATCQDSSGRVYKIYAMAGLKVDAADPADTAWINILDLTVPGLISSTVKMIYWNSAVHVAYCGLSAGVYYYEYIRYDGAVWSGPHSVRSFTYGGSFTPYLELAGHTGNTVFIRLYDRDPGARYRIYSPDPVTPFTWTACEEALPYPCGSTDIFFYSGTLGMIARRSSDNTGKLLSAVLSPGLCSWADTGKLTAPASLGISACKFRGGRNELILMYLSQIDWTVYYYSMRTWGEGPVLLTSRAPSPSGSYGHLKCASDKHGNLYMVEKVSGFPYDTANMYAYSRGASAWSLISTKLLSGSSAGYSEMYIEGDGVL